MGKYGYVPNEQRQRYANMLLERQHIIDDQNVLMQNYQLEKPSRLPSSNGKSRASNSRSKAKLARSTSSSSVPVSAEMKVESEDSNDDCLNMIACTSQPKDKPDEIKKSINSSLSLTNKLMNTVESTAEGSGLESVVISKMSKESKLSSSIEMNEEDIVALLKQRYASKLPHTLGSSSAILNPSAMIELFISLLEQINGPVDEVRSLNYRMSNGMKSAVDLRILLTQVIDSWQAALISSMHSASSSSSSSSGGGVVSPTSLFPLSFPLPSLDHHHNPYLYTPSPHTMYPGHPLAPGAGMYAGAPGGPPAAYPVYPPLSTPGLPPSYFNPYGMYPPTFGAAPTPIPFASPMTFEPAAAAAAAAAAATVQPSAPVTHPTQAAGHGTQPVVSTTPVTTAATIATASAAVVAPLSVVSASLSSVEPVVVTAPPIELSTIAPPLVAPPLAAAAAGTASSSVVPISAPVELTSAIRAASPESLLTSDSTSPLEKPIGGMSIKSIPKSAEFPMPPVVPSFSAFVDISTHKRKASAAAPAAPTSPVGASPPKKVSLSRLSLLLQTPKVDFWTVFDELKRRGWTLATLDISQCNNLKHVKGLQRRQETFFRTGCDSFSNHLVYKRDYFYFEDDVLHYARVMEGLEMDDDITTSSVAAPAKGDGRKTSQQNPSVGSPSTAEGKAVSASAAASTEVAALAAAESSAGKFLDISTKKKVDSSVKALDDKLPVSSKPTDKATAAGPSKAKLHELLRKPDIKFWSVINELRPLGWTWVTVNLADYPHLYRGDGSSEKRSAYFLPGKTKDTPGLEYKKDYFYSDKDALAYVRKMEGISIEGCSDKNDATPTSNGSDASSTSNNNSSSSRSAPVVENKSVSAPAIPTVLDISTSKRSGENSSGSTVAPPAAAAAAVKPAASGTSIVGFLDISSTKRSNSSISLAAAPATIAPVEAPTPGSTASTAIFLDISTTKRTNSSSDFKSSSDSRGNCSSAATAALVGGFLDISSKKKKEVRPASPVVVDLAGDSSEDWTSFVVPPKATTTTATTTTAAAAAAAATSRSSSKLVEMLSVPKIDFWGVFQELGRRGWTWMDLDLRDHRNLNQSAGNGKPSQRVYFGPNLNSHMSNMTYKQDYFYSEGEVLHYLKVCEGLVKEVPASHLKSRSEERMARAQEAVAAAATQQRIQEAEKVRSMLMGDENLTNISTTVSKEFPVPISRPGASNNGSSSSGSSGGLGVIHPLTAATPVYIPMDSFSPRVDIFAGDTPRSDMTLDLTAYDDMDYYLNAANLAQKKATGRLAGFVRRESTLNVPVCMRSLMVHYKVLDELPQLSANSLPKYLKTCGEDCPKLHVDEIPEVVLKSHIVKQVAKASLQTIVREKLLEKVNADSILFSD